MPRYGHNGGAQPAELQTAMTTGGPVDLSINVSDGWPDTNFFVVIDKGEATEEKVRIASRSGLTLTVAERGADGTSPASHGIGAPVEHVFTALEADQANEHVNATQAIHGLNVGDAVAGEDYVNQQADSAAAEARSYADAQDAARSAADRTYTDDQVAANSTTDQGYADAAVVAHANASDPHSQYAEDQDITDAVAAHAALTTGVHGVVDGSPVASETAVDTKITELFVGEFAGDTMRFVTLKVDITNPASTFTLAIGQYGFTERPHAWLTVKANTRTGDVPYAALGNNPGTSTELNINIVDARDGSDVSGTHYLDVLMLGPIA